MSDRVKCVQQIYLLLKASGNSIACLSQKDQCFGINIKQKNISDKNVTTVFYKTLGIIFSALQNYCPYLYRVEMRNAVTILGHVKQI